MQPDSKQHEIVIGIPEQYRASAAALYDEAFGPKIALAIPEKKKRIALYETCFQLQHAVAAVSDNQLLGLAGFSTNAGSLTGALDYATLIEQLGYIKGNRAALVLSFYERKKQPGELLMDGIAVDGAARGSGIGTRLLCSLIDYAEQHQYETIRLDVIDTNSAARRLYEKMGFKSTDTTNFGLLKGILGFGAATTMEFAVGRERRD